MNERIQRLRQAFTASERQVDTERAVIVTRVYQQNEGKPQIIKRALAFDAILSEMTIEIRDDELIVGNHAQHRRGVPLFPEYAVDWILKDMDTFPTRIGDQFRITEEQTRVLREILPYWEGRCLRDKVMGAIPSFLKEMLDDGVIRNENFTMSGPGHMVPRYPELINQGLDSVIRTCKEKIVSLDPADLEYGEKYNFYQAGIIVCDALIKYANRFAEEACRQAREEADPKRQEELLRIASNCRRVPADAARDLWEALQFVYFVQLGIQIEANGLAIALGCPDQYLFPFYSKDLAAGHLTRDGAKELIECFYLKLNEIDKIYSNDATRYLQGPGHGQTITLGGVTRDGCDAVNELSYLMLEADRDIGLVQPDIAVKIARVTPNSFVREACKNSRAGLTKPKFFNDEVVIQSVMNIGIPLEDARDWGALGCSEPVVNGKTNSWGNSGHLNLAKCLELALHDGKCMITGKQLGPNTGDASKFTCFDQVLRAFKAQVQYFVKHIALFDNILDRLHAENAPLAFYSVALADCIDKGAHANKGGARYNTTSPLGI
ncbi:MAG: hypothetical protein GX980_05125, partial [Firmicutes bacterium]|nr:hypothetical protein [Bacillota bacterium]